MSGLEERFLPRHQLAQFVAEALPVVGQYPILKRHGALNSCIFSTRIAKRVCEHYSLPVEPITCQVSLLNVALIERIGREGRAPTSRDETLAWCAEDGSFARGIGVSDVAEGKDVWPGHVILGVNNEWAVDMSLDQGCDPHHGINIEPMTFKLTDEFLEGMPIALVHPSRVVAIYQRRFDKPPFETAPDWCWEHPGVEELVHEIVHELDDRDPATPVRGSVWEPAAGWVFEASYG